MKQAARIIRDMGPHSVLVKGGHRKGEALDILLDGRKYYEYSSPRIRTKNTHGTGCTLASAIATFIAFGLPVSEAVSIAKEYVTAAIRNSIRIGHGNGPVNHMPALLGGAGQFL